MSAGKVKIKGLFGLPTTRTPVTESLLQSVAQFFKQHKGKVLGLTGAGVSVLSGIPDYRGAQGTYRVHGEYLPILHNELVTQHSSRQRYWARSFFGIKPAFKAQPNIIHESFSQLENAGYLSGLITQNVDGLHIQAGSRNVLEIHGTLRYVKCMKCNTRETRDVLQSRLEELNPDWYAYWKAMMDSNTEPPRRPDGDVDLPPNLSYEEFKYPKCHHCEDGNWMPTVVFFGGNVDESVRNRSYEMVDSADALFVCGTSLATYSAYRLVKRARDQNKPIMIINFGETRGDHEASVKLSLSAEELLPNITKRLISGQFS